MQCIQQFCTDNQTLGVDGLTCYDCEDENAEPNPYNGDCSCKDNFVSVEGKCIDIES